MSYGELHPTERTLIPNKDFIKALMKEWNKMFGELPSKETVCVVYAKYMIETGGKNIWNYNFGNIKKSLTDAHQDGYVQLAGVWEIINGKKVIFPKEHPQSYFRWYPNLEAAMHDYLILISSPRYKTSFAALKAGSPTQYAQALKNSNYYTAPVEQYVAGILLFFNKIMYSPDYNLALLEVNQELNNVFAAEPETGPTQPIEIIPTEKPKKELPKQSWFGKITNIFKR